MAACPSTMAMPDLSPSERMFLTMGEHPTELESDKPDSDIETYVPEGPAPDDDMESDGFDLPY
jgi:hypothetical protein